MFASSCKINWRVTFFLWILILDPRILIPHNFRNRGTCELKIGCPLSIGNFAKKQFFRAISFFLTKTRSLSKRKNNLFFSFKLQSLALPFTHSFKRKVTFPFILISCIFSPQIMFQNHFHFQYLLLDLTLWLIISTFLVLTNTIIMHGVL